MKWKRPSGREIETNDEPATVKHCQDMGWERMDKEPDKNMQGASSTGMEKKEKGRR